MTSERRRSTPPPAEAGPEGPSSSSTRGRLGPAPSGTRQQRPRPLSPKAHSRVRQAIPLDLEAVRQRLGQLRDDEAMRGAVRGATLLRESKELLSVLEDPGVQARLFEVGLEPGRLEELSWLVHALEVLDSAIGTLLTEGSARARADQERALDLRDELLSACQWNLRHVEAAEALARITNSSCVDELVLDLRELSRLITQHAAAFEGDQSFVAPVQASRAIQVAEGLLSSVRQGMLRMNDDTPPVAEGARARLCELLSLHSKGCAWLGALLREVRAAGRYAYRADGAARRWFIEANAPRRSLLTALVARG